MVHCVINILVRDLQLGFLLSSHQVDWDISLLQIIPPICLNALLLAKSHLELADTWVQFGPIPFSWII